MPSMTECVAAYKQQLKQGDIRIAYEFLVKYLMSLKTHCEREYSDKYKFGSVSPGYMDYTYFPFFNDALRANKLRFGVVLNHQEIRFELWLMGQNAKAQKDYWEFLKSTEWNKERTVMPKYSVLDTTLVADPDFSALDDLTVRITKSALSTAEEILSYLAVM